MNINEPTAVQVLEHAIELLWDGITNEYYGTGMNHKFACHAVSHAVQELTGLNFCAARDSGVAKLIHSRIDRFIGGQHTAYGYIVDVLGLPEPTEAEGQAWRKNMLEEILTEFKHKALLAHQIEVLEQVKDIREQGQNDSPFVCDMVNFEVYGAQLEATKAICEDIGEYIEGGWSFASWLSRKNGKHYDHDDAPVVEGRTEMIDTLIDRYKAQLETA